MPHEDSIEITNVARDAFRRIRSAASRGELSANEMQSQAEEVSRAFAKALLSLENKALLHPEDTAPDIDHVQNLNQFVANLLPEEPELSLAHKNPIDSTFMSFLVNVLTRKGMLQKFGVPDSQIVTLFSTGAIQLALLSYIFNIKLYYAAVDANRENVVMSDVPGDKPVTVVDDIVKSQADLVSYKLEKTGHTVIKKNTTGF